jgi:hypothetical protein
MYRESGEVARSVNAFLCRSGVKAMKNKVLFSFISGTLMLAGQAFAQYTFIPIDVQCPATTAAPDCPAGLTPGQVAAQTSARGINARGDVVGFYAAGGKQHGFLLRDGEYTSLDFPVAGVRATIANGINPRGEIVGQYTLPARVKDENGNDLPEDSPLYCPPDIPNPPNPPAPDPACIKGFYYRNGKFTTVMFPSRRDANGVERKHPGAVAQRISADGDIYGCLHDHDLGASMFGAAWGRFETFSLTDNGGELSDPMGVPMSMNNGATPGGARTIVGFFMDMAGQQHGYLVRNGMFESYDPTANTNLTAIWDINPSQQFVGTYRQFGEPAAKRHGFLQNPPASEGSLLPAPISFDVHFLDAAGHTVNAFATVAFGINPDGVIVGQYALVSGGAPHGFIAIPPDRN